MHPNWFETFFEGLALEMWRGATPPETTALEAEFLERRLELSAGMSALDVPCGYGRHAIELARHGVRMTGVDLSPRFLDEARRNAPGVEWVQKDMRKLAWRARFDATYSWGNSFGYFDHENCRRFLRAVARCLKPGGRFLLDTGAVAESLLPSLKTERQLKIGELDFHSRAVYHAAESRLDITYAFTLGDRNEVKPTHLYLHSAAEIGRMLEDAGLARIATFGDLEGAPYQLGSGRLLVLAQRTA